MNSKRWLELAVLGGVSTGLGVVSLGLFFLPLGGLNLSRLIPPTVIGFVLTSFIWYAFAAREGLAARVVVLGRFERNVHSRVSSGNLRFASGVVAYLESLIWGELCVVLVMVSLFLLSHLNALENPSETFVVYGVAVFFTLPLVLVFSPFVLLVWHSTVSRLRTVSI